MTVLVLAALVMLRRPLMARAFDPQGAQVSGYRIGLLDLVTNAVVAFVVVASVRAVGTVLVIALLIVPAAAAGAVSDRLTSRWSLSVPNALSASVFVIPCQKCSFLKWCRRWLRQIER